MDKKKILKFAVLAGFAIIVADSFLSLAYQLGHLDDCCCGCDDDFDDDDGNPCHMVCTGPLEDDMPEPEPEAGN